MISKIKKEEHLNIKKSLIIKNQTNQKSSKND
jgi:hypothetical protein